MAQRARQREALAGGTLERHFGGEGLGEESANSIGFAATTLEPKNKNPSYHALKDQSRRPVNLVPAASAVEATAGNEKHDDDDEKGSGVHGSLLAKSN